MLNTLKSENLVLALRFNALAVQFVRIVNDPG